MSGNSGAQSASSSGAAHSQTVKEIIKKQAAQAIYDFASDPRNEQAFAKALITKGPAKAAAEVASGMLQTITQNVLKQAAAEGIKGLEFDKSLQTFAIDAVEIGVQLAFGDPAGAGYTLMKKIFDRTFKVEPDELKPIVEGVLRRGEGTAPGDTDKAELATVLVRMSSSKKFDDDTDKAWDKDVSGLPGDLGTLSDPERPGAPVPELPGSDGPDIGSGPGRNTGPQSPATTQDPTTPGAHPALPTQPSGSTSTGNNGDSAFSGTDRSDASQAGTQPPTAQETTPASPDSGGADEPGPEAPNPQPPAGGSTSNSSKNTGGFWVPLNSEKPDGGQSANESDYPTTWVWMNPLNAGDKRTKYADAIKVQKEKPTEPPSEERKTEPKKKDGKTKEPKKDEPKKEDPKKEDPKKEEPKEDPDKSDTPAEEPPAEDPSGSDNGNGGYTPGEDASIGGDIDPDQLALELALQTEGLILRTDPGAAPTTASPEVLQQMSEEMSAILYDIVSNPHEDEADPAFGDSTDGLVEMVENAKRFFEDLTPAGDLQTNGTGDGTTETIIEDSLDFL
ncbi:MAG: hypothetical protein AAFP68_08390 [Pseudomonadota bacterium]